VKSRIGLRDIRAIHECRVGGHFGFSMESLFIILSR
jgi:hypothetical protein